MISLADEKSANASSSSVKPQKTKKERIAEVKQLQTLGKISEEQEKLEIKKILSEEE